MAAAKAAGNKGGRKPRTPRKWELGFYVEDGTDATVHYVLKVGPAKVAGHGKTFAEAYAAAHVWAAKFDVDIGEAAPTA